MKFLGTKKGTLAIIGSSLAVAPGDGHEEIETKSKQLQPSAPTLHQRIEAGLNDLPKDQQLAMKEMTGIRHDRQWNLCGPREIHALGQGHDLVLFAMDQKRVVRHHNGAKLETLDSAADQDQALGQGHSAIGQLGIQLGRNRCSERKASQYPGPGGRLGMAFDELLDQQAHVGGFALRMIKGALGRPNTPEIGSHGDQAAVDAGAGDGGDDLVVARAAVQGVWMQHQRPTCGLGTRQVKNAVHGANRALKGSFLRTQQHINQILCDDHVALDASFYMTDARTRAEESAFLPSPEAMVTGLRAHLPRAWHIDWPDQTGSSNADLQARARSAGSSARPWLLGCHLQAQGRGRAGRTWQNRRGANLMFSCAFDVFLPLRQLPTLSPLIGTATCETLRSLLAPEHRQRLLMKWPNDLLWDQGKLAGLLIETTRAGASTARDHFIVIIGLGLNLSDARALSASLDRRVSDWEAITTVDETAARVDAVTLVARLARCWYDDLNTATAHGFDGLVARYARIDALAGQPVDALDEGRLLHTGVACGIDDQGRLRLRNAHGETAISVGEISVRTRA